MPNAIRQHALLAVALLLAFATVPAAGADDDADDDAPPPPLANVIKRLADPDEKRREQASGHLSKLRERGLGRRDALAALSAALTTTFPKEKFEWDDRAAELIAAAATKPQPAGLALLAENFARLSPRAKGAAGEYLVRLNTPASIEKFAECFAGDVGGVNWPRTLADAMSAVLPNERLQAALVDALPRERSAEIAVAVLLKAAEDNALPADFLASHVKPISASYRAWLAKLPPAPADGNARTIPERFDNEKYQQTLGVAEYFPDLLGHAGAGAEPALRDTFAARDPRLSMFAVQSLLRLGRPVPQAEIDAVAADDEMRNLLYRALDKARALDRLPKAFRTQEAIARSEMVHWLIYPTELGRPPDEIELMKVVDVDTKSDDGVVGVYLFRFRTVGSHWAAKDGWMAGVAGPYRKAGGPTTEALGSTFSRFEKWDAKTPEQHVREIRKTTEDMWKHQAGQAAKKPK